MNFLFLGIFFQIFKLFFLFYFRFLIIKINKKIKKRGARGPRGCDVARKATWTRVAPTWRVYISSIIIIFNIV